METEPNEKKAIGFAIQTRIGAALRSFYGDEPASAVFAELLTDLDEADARRRSAQAGVS
jgi:hypothetical protein